MRGIFLRWLILTVAIMVTSYLLEGIYVRNFLSAFFAAAILGILNAFFRPILFILTLPINVLSLGLFNGFKVYGFWPAVFGSLLISLVSWILTSFINERGTVHYIDLKKIGRNRWE